MSTAKLHVSRIFLQPQAKIDLSKVSYLVVKHGVALVYRRQRRLALKFGFKLSLKLISISFRFCILIMFKLKFL